MAATISTPTIGDCPPSPTSSDSSSIYGDCEDDFESPSGSPAKTGGLKPLPVQTTQTRIHSGILSVGHYETSQTSTNEVKDDFSKPITPPLTPRKRHIPNFPSRIPTQVDSSPSLSSECSESSLFSDATEEPQSPITERSSSPFFDPFIDAEVVQSEVTKPVKERRLPCLQCEQAGLRCSLTFRERYYLKVAEGTPEPLCCTRCVRNGECFCVMQVRFDKKILHRGMLIPEIKRGKQLYEYVYSAEGVESEVVNKKAKEILEVTAEKSRFAPPVEEEERKRLRPVGWGAWPALEAVGDCKA